MIGVSACLIGCNCRYDGKNKKNRQLINLINFENILPVCPETSGGLSVPREPAAITGGDGFDVLDGNAKVIDISGKDKTDAFIKGAYITLKHLRIHDIKRCILKAKSPSCGIAKKMSAYTLANGYNMVPPVTGVTAALLMRWGILVENI